MNFNEEKMQKQQLLQVLKLKKVMKRKIKATEAKDKGRRERESI